MYDIMSTETYGTHRANAYKILAVSYTHLDVYKRQGSDDGMLVRGDSGKLSFQGTRYLGFERN